MILSSFFDNRGFLGSFAVSIGLGVALLVAFGGCGGSDEPEVVSKRARIEIPADLVPGRPEPGVATGEATEAPQAAPMGAMPPAPQPKASAPARPAAEPAVTAARPVKVTPKATEPVSPRPAPVKKAARAATAKTSKTPWAINVASFTDRKNATDLEAGLEVAGFNPYITEFMKDGRRWYRVRVGFFNSRDEAIAAGGKIKSRFNVGSSWVVRPSTEEIEAHSGG